MKICKEEKFIIDLIFKKEVDKFTVESLNLDRIVKITSKNLILPLFYSKIREKKII